jgi:peroxiredoxin
VTSVNGVGAVSHPFHIHVNPFEVISMIEPGKDGKPDIEHIKDPVWHDTIILNEGWKVKFRTEYTDFVGLFVQHCHILDHEDQGMMQAVEIRDPKQPPLALDNAPTPVAEPYPAPAWSLPRGDGGSDRLASFRGKPTVLFLGEGFGCLRCSQQIDVLQAYATSFAERGVNLVGIGAETPEALRTAWKESPCSFPLFADPLGATHRAYGCFEGKPVHGVFLLDAEGAVRWKAIGKNPYADIDGLLRLASGLRAPKSSSAPAPLATNTAAPQ